MMDITERDASTNLIINYLPQTLTDDEFRSMFLSIGPIKSAKIIRDRGTGYSYGFGFVDYQNQKDAQRAISTLNGLEMQNKRIKVALARPGGDVIKGANLYIRNLPPHWRESELMTHFSEFGTIIQSRVLVDQAGNSKRVGFVLYDKKNEAEDAIGKMNGKVVPEGGDPLLIKYADDNTKKVRPPPSQQIYSPRFPSPGPMRNPGGRFRYNPMTQSYPNPGMGMGPGYSQGGYVLFAYNIGVDAEEKTLYHLFSPFGTVTKVNVIYDSQKNQCKGYGFVTMSNFQEAQHAIQGLNGYIHNGKPLQVSFKN